MKMRCININRELGKFPIITVEHKFLFIKRIMKYQSQGILVGDFHRWVELPEKILVGGQMSFQLDAWLRGGT